MNEDALNTSIRKFLKEVGVTSQREIEKAVRDAVASGKIKGNTPLRGAHGADDRAARSDARNRWRHQARIVANRVPPERFVASGH